MVGASQVTLVVKNPPANTGEVRDSGSILQEDPLEEDMATDSSILPWRIHGQRRLVGYRGAWWATVHSVAKTWT